MNRLLALLSALFLSAAAHAQSMGQPGYYGRIEIGDYPQPPLLISNAVMGNPGVYSGQPVYMHVPSAQAYAWSRYCQRYGACDWMVYFVDNEWYESVYVPGFQSGMFRYAPPAVYAPQPYYYGPPPHYPRPPRPPHIQPLPGGADGLPPPRPDQPPAPYIRPPPPGVNFPAQRPPGR